MYNNFKMSRTAKPLTLYSDVIHKENTSHSSTKYFRFNLENDSARVSTCRKP